MSNRGEASGVGLAGIDDILGFHIRLAHGAVYRHFTESFADLGLTQKQVSTLWLIEDGVGLSQADVAARLQMDRATTMGIMRRMEKRGYLVRERSAKDGRKDVLALTDHGRAALARAKAAVEEHENWLKARFTDQELRTLLALLRRIYDDTRMS
ncbi:MarR family winged helix-turn-helix transcriptional regulator [Sphingobium sp. DEHP117]|uniref:MarR family winged helix-turn-helix transcriptional regulator n=1 Tax=Sphingobium sp. DEHP117 TaxID=2993436 RepID=UPI0027D52F5A|nr:MarR family transcriptional regulator [Sphingobium sp. DEHP117]MDQ4419309.1 MarR family winged helix-turn-helix transcriptional regulator [Sphingobium sp. DEHP117]